MLSVLTLQGNCLRVVEIQIEWGGFVVHFRVAERLVSVVD